MQDKARRTSAAKEVCIKFCRYYKPEQDQELTCRGFAVIQRLLESGREIPDKNNNLTISDQTATSLRHALCDICPYHENDCDYFSGVKDAPSCGGFLCLAQLVEDGILSVDDVKDID